MGEGKLLPCPFCGSEAYIARSTPSSGPYWAVCAGDCILEGPVKDTEAEALAAWNRRAALPSGVEPVAPEGWVLVPREPTQAMCATAAGKALYVTSDAHRAVLADGYARVYRDMVTAALSPVKGDGQ